jgi:tRNA(Ile)-lysidine synthase TilS/MesJ
MLTMRINVIDDDDNELFSYDTNHVARCVFPAEDDRPAIIDAMEEALSFLRDPSEDDETPTGK